MESSREFFFYLFSTLVFCPLPKSTLLFRGAVVWCAVFHGKKVTFCVCAVLPFDQQRCFSRECVHVTQTYVLVPCSCFVVFSRSVQPADKRCVCVLPAARVVVWCEIATRHLTRTFFGVQEFRPKSTEIDRNRCIFVKSRSQTIQAAQNKHPTTIITTYAGNLANTSSITSHYITSHRITFS